METLFYFPPGLKVSVLDRTSSSDFHSSSSFTPLQNEVDQLVTGFVGQATDVKMLAALAVGGLAYRYGKVGTLAMGEGHVAAMPLRFLSYAGGLGSEVTAFEFTNRTLHTLRAGFKPAPTSHFWNWSGPEGWGEGLVSSLITFGVLKGAGSLAREQNLVLRHLFQDFGLVAGQNVVGAIGGRGNSQIAPPLAEQLLHAEAINLQIGAGQGLAGSLIPRLYSLERGLDLTLRSAEGRMRSPKNLFFPQLLPIGPDVEISGEAKKADPAFRVPSHMFSLGGKGGEGVDPKIVEQVKKGVHRVILEEAHRQNLFVFPLSENPVLVMVEIPYDSHTGRLLSFEQLRDDPPPGSRQTRVRAQLQNGFITLSEAALANLDEWMAHTMISTAERSVLAGIRSVHQEPVGWVEIPSAPTQKVVPIVGKVSPRGDPTLPLFLGVPQAPPPLETQRTVLGFKSLLGNLARAAWKQTEEGYRNRPPLLHYINPPILVGTLKLDESGSILGSSLRRTHFSSDGKEVGHPSALLGTEVKIVLSHQGALLFYHPHGELNSSQRALFENLEILPENLKEKQSVFRDYPYFMDMLQRKGVGKLLLKLNEVLGGEAPREDGQYSVWLMLTHKDGDYQWIPQSRLKGAHAPPGTLAILRVEINPLLWMTQKKPPEFSYEMNWGGLPPEVKGILDYIREQVKKAAPKGKY